MITFQLDDMSAGRYAEVSAELAPSFAGLPGLLTKIWLTADDGRRAGFYLFADADAGDRFLESALARMVSQNPHFAGLTVQRFAVDETTTAVTQPGIRVVPASVTV
jgi:hypothetical protein